MANPQDDLDAVKELGKGVFKDGSLPRFAVLPPM